MVRRWDLPALGPTGAGTHLCAAKTHRGWDPPCSRCPSLPFCVPAHPLLASRSRLVRSRSPFGVPMHTGRSVGALRACETSSRAAGRAARRRGALVAPTNRAAGKGPRVALGAASSLETETASNRQLGVARRGVQSVGAMNFYGSVSERWCGKQRCGPADPKRAPDGQQNENKQTSRRRQSSAKGDGDGRELRGGGGEGRNRAVGQAAHGARRQTSVTRGRERDGMGWEGSD